MEVFKERSHAEPEFGLYCQLCTYCPWASPPGPKLNVTFCESPGERAKSVGDTEMSISGALIKVRDIEIESGANPSFLTINVVSR